MPPTHVVRLVHARGPRGHIGGQAELEEAVVPKDGEIRVRPAPAPRRGRAQHVVEREAAAAAAAAAVGREAPRSTSVLWWPVVVVVVVAWWVVRQCWEGDRG